MSLASWPKSYSFEQWSLQNLKQLEMWQTGLDKCPVRDYTSEIKTECILKLLTYFVIRDDGKCIGHCVFP